MSFRSGQLVEESSAGLLVVTDNAYGAASVKGRKAVFVDVPHHGWYDFTVRVEGVDGFMRRFAGRLENGKEGVSDPAMA